MKIEKEKRLLFKKVVCNRCGRELPLSPEGVPLEDFVEVDKCWGYFSGQDGLRERFDVCEACVKEWVAEFAIEPETEEYKDF